MARRNHFNKQDLQNIQDFINLIDSDIKVYKGSKFECDIYEEKIYIGNKRLDRITQLFCKWLGTQTSVCPNYCIIAILHELGHIMTNTEELQDNREMLDSLYSLMYKSGNLKEEEYFINYFEIPAEYQATMWGVEFYKENKSLCDKLAEVLGV